MKRQCITNELVFILPLSFLYFNCINNIIIGIETKKGNLIRVRWYGSHPNPPQDCFMERKTRQTVTDSEMFLIDEAVKVYFFFIVINTLLYYLPCFVIGAIYVEAIECEELYDGRVECRKEGGGNEKEESNWKERSRRITQQSTFT